MYECERLFGPDRGSQLHEWIEAATEDSCPCKRGDPCPLLPPGGRVPVALNLGLPLVRLRPTSGAEAVG